MRGARILSLAVLLLASWPLLSGCRGGSERDRRTLENAEDMMTGPTILNGRMYADQRHSSFLPVAGHPAGDVVWSASAPAAAGRRPRCLGLRGDLLVVCYGDLLVAVDRAGGDVRWTHPLYGNHLFALEEDGILTLDHAGYCVMLDDAGQAAQKVHLASVSPDVVLHAYLRQDKLVVYCLEEREEPVSTPEDNPVPAVSRFIRYLPDRMKTLSALRFPVRLRGVALSDDGGRAAVATEDRLFLFRGEETEEKGVVEVVTPAVVSLAMTPDGQALLVDAEQKTPRLSQFAADGNVAWELDLGKGDASAQPPASTPDGTVYVVVGNRLQQVRSGAAVWSYTLPGSVPDVAVSVLADGSVLAGCGHVLVHVSADGQEILTKWLESAILTRMIMDEDGRIYYGGIDGIHCLE